MSPLRSWIATIAIACSFVCTGDALGVAPPRADAPERSPYFLSAFGLSFDGVRAAGTQNKSEFRLMDGELAPKLRVVRQDDGGVAGGACPGVGGGCATPPDDMTGWWTLDELCGTTSADLLNANDGTHVGSPTPLPGEYVDNSLCLDGTSQYVEIPDAPELNFGTGDFTIDAWIRSSQTTGVRVILDKRNEGATVTGYSLYLVNGTLGFQIADGSGSASCLACPTSSSCTNYNSGALVADGMWHHVAVTVKRMTNGGTFYVDGAPVGIFNPDCHPSTITNTFPLRFGSRSSSISGLFGGCIDEVELFNRSLDAAEVASIYAAGVNGKCKATVDARQPHALNDPSDLQGIGGPDEPITLNIGVTGATSFSLCETAVHPVFGRNGIASVVDNIDGTYTIVLDRPITPNAVTKISHVCGSVEYISHPANANADGVANAVDVDFIIDMLNGSALPPHGIYSQDIDHSDVFGTPDMLRLIDLLNGAAGYPPQNGTPLPVNTSCP